MGVNRGVLLAVVHKNHVAETILNTRKLNHAIPHAAHSGAGRGGVIDAQMSLHGLQNGMETHLEAAAHPGKFHGGCQIGPAQALTVQRVVAALASGRRFLKPHGLEGLAAVDKFGA